MNLKNNIMAFYSIIILLIILAIYLINSGEIGMGIGLISGAVGVFAVKSIQRWKIAQLAKKGIVSYDERSLYLSAKAALATIRIYILLLFLLVLTGNAFNPICPLAPWDLSGILLALLVFLWIGFYYYYNKVE